MSTQAERQRARDRAADAVATKAECVVTRGELVAFKVKKHGTNSAYTSGCRCRQCLRVHNAANRDYEARRRLRKKNDRATGPMPTLAGGGLATEPRKR